MFGDKNLKSVFSSGPKQRDPAESSITQEKEEEDHSHPGVNW